MHGGRLDAGVEMIAKPFTADALAQKVRDMLDRGRTGRVLIVAPDSHLRALVAEALSGLGFATMEAATSAEALSSLRSTAARFDIVVFDGDVDGRGVAAFMGEVRALRKDLPVVVAVSVMDDDLTDLVDQDECTATIAKPYTGAGLKLAFDGLKVRCRRA